MLLKDETKLHPILSFKFKNPIPPSISINQRVNILNILKLPLLQRSKLQTFSMQKKSSKMNKFLQE